MHTLVPGRGRGDDTFICTIIDVDSAVKSSKNKNINHDNKTPIRTGNTEHKYGMNTIRRIGTRYSYFI